MGEDAGQAGRRRRLDHHLQMADEEPHGGEDRRVVDRHHPRGMAPDELQVDHPRLGSGQAVGDGLDALWRGGKPGGERADDAVRPGGLNAVDPGGRGEAGPSNGSFRGTKSLVSHCRQEAPSVDAAYRRGSVRAPQAFVIDPDAFDKNADVLAHDLGPRSSGSSVATVPKLSAGPDYLVEIEAVAKLNTGSAAHAARTQRRSPSRWSAD